MKKLHLDAGELRVESFEPVAEPVSRRGTVNARQVSFDTCNQYTCAGTCDVNEFSCNNQFTCYGPRCPLSQYPTCYPVCQTGSIC
jgi:hypothetical protein